MTPSGWTAIAASRDIGAKPYRFVVDGSPVVVFRAHGRLRALYDQCPHRGAPLSLGQVSEGGIACAYHGWFFDGEGLCRDMPGYVGEVPLCRVPAFFVVERYGVVFVALKPQTVEPYAGILGGGSNVTALVKSQVRSTVVDVTENILDSTHTHFIHRGLLRGLSARRYRVTVKVTGGYGWVEARYEGEPRQEGLVSRFLEGGRSVSVGRFLAPGIAEIEFWGPRGINLATTFHLRQATPDTVCGIGVLSGPRQGGLGYVKALLFKPLFRIGVAQDKRILEAATDNRALTGQMSRMVGPLDILRLSIEDILAGRRPAVADAPVTIEMEL